MKNDMSVVIAEDDAELVNALTFHLQKLDFIVRPASDDFDVLAMVLKDWPKLLIIDPGRPSGNGFAVIERILQETKFTPPSETVSLPVIVLSSNSDEKTLRECKILGLSYVLKDAHLWSKLKPLIGELVQTPDNGIEAAVAAPVSHQKPEPVSSPPKILIVDDDPDIVKAIKIRLECHGVDTLDASNGLQGYQKALIEKPDLIISDYTMPDGGGDHMIVRLKQNAATHDIPIIVLTGWTVGGRKDMALERDMKGRRGVSAFLTKPVDFDVLLDALRRHIILAPFSRPSAAVPDSSTIAVQSASGPETPDRSA